MKRNAGVFKDIFFYPTKELKYYIKAREGKDVFLIFRGWAGRGCSAAVTLRIALLLFSCSRMIDAVKKMKYLSSTSNFISFIIFFSFWDIGIYNYYDYFCILF
jgi:hypothetical protein